MRRYVQACLLGPRPPAPVRSSDAALPVPDFVAWCVPVSAAWSAWICTVWSSLAVAVWRARIFLALGALSIVTSSSPAFAAAASDLASTSPYRVTALTSDWQTGGVSLLDPEALTVRRDVAPACPDAVGRVHDGLLYLVNRAGCDNIEVVDPATGGVLRQFSVGNGTNPQDIAVVSSTRAYVSRYETNELLEVDLVTGAGVDSISLASFADGDGLCEMHRMHVSGRRLFVELQRMVRHTWPDPWVPEPPSMLAVIDIDTRQLVDVDSAVPGVQAIALAGTNPIAPIVEDPDDGDLLVPEAGQYGVIDEAGIERVNPISLRSEGFLVRENDLGGDLIDFAVRIGGREGDPSALARGGSGPTDRTIFAIVSLAGSNTALLMVSANGGEVLDTLRNPGSFTLADVLLHDGKLFLSDRDYERPGIRVYDALTGDSLAGPVATGLPPAELLLLPGVTTPISARDPGILGEARPNPSLGPVRLTWRPGSADPPARLDVFDPSGRRVRRLELQDAALAADLTWDGRDDGGRRAGAGVYFLRATAAGGANGIRSVRIVR